MGKVLQSKTSAQTKPLPFLSSLLSQFPSHFPSQLYSCNAMKESMQETLSVWQKTAEEPDKLQGSTTTTGEEPCQGETTYCTK